MGTRRDPVDGILIADPRFFDVDNIEAVGAGSTASSYSQSTPRPGVSVPTSTMGRLTPRISGALTKATEAVVLRAGNPAPALGLQVGYRADGESDGDLRGWNAPNFFTEWTSIWSSNSIDRDYFDAVTIPSTQKVVVVAWQTGANDIETETWDPYTHAWTTGGDPGISTGDTALGLLVLPDERVVMLLGESAYYSDDEGTTWTLYSNSALQVNSYTKVRCAVLNGNVMAMGCEASAAATFQASSDLATSFTTVASGSLTQGNSDRQASLCATDTSIIVAHVAVSTSYPTIRRCPSAFTDPFNDVTAITIEALACDSIEVIWEAGILWAFVYRSDALEVWYSEDDGITWTELNGDPLYLPDNTSGEEIGNFKLTTACGALMFVHGWTDAIAGYGGSVGAILCGGWSSLTPGAGYLYDRPSFDEVHWIPLESISFSGWTATVSGGSTALQAGGFQRWGTVAQQVYNTLALDSRRQKTVQILMRTNSGGSLTADHAGLILAVADGTDEATLHIRTTSTGFRLYDGQAAAAVGSDVSRDMTDFTIVLLAVDLDDSTASVWYRDPAEWKWTVGPTGSITLDSATAAANGNIDVGSVDASSTASFDARAISIGSMDVTRDLVSGTTYKAGRPLSSLPVPVPDLSGSSGGPVAFLSATSGPGWYGEVYDIGLRHEYALANAIPSVQPSPSVKWKSTDTSEQYITWDLGTESWIGDSLAVLVDQANFFQFVLEYWDGATWQTAGTGDLRLSGVGSMAVSGDAVRPTGGTCRMLAENELAGGTVLLNLGVSVKARRIRSNTAGVLTSSSTTRTAEILIDGVDGTESASPATNSVIVPSGILVVHLSTAQRRRYWRVRIPTQTCADDAFEAGTIMIWQVQPFGAPSAWGQGMQWTPNTRTSRSRYGTTRATEDGPVTESWQLGWTDGQEAWQYRTETDLDYIGVSGGLPLAVAEDVSLLLRGIVEKTKGGEYPIVGIAQIPTSTSTITDPSLWIYGRMGGAIRTAIQQGDWGTNEITRVEQVTIEGIP